MTPRTTQETAAEVLTLAFADYGTRTGVSLPTHVLDALAAAGWSVCRLELAARHHLPECQPPADDYEGGTVEERRPWCVCDGVGVPLYRVTAGEVAPGG